MTLKIMTANDLHSGGVVFLTGQNDWSPFISHARLCDEPDTERELEAFGQQAVARQIIVEPFLIAVTLENSVAHPVRFREQLRVGGPSVRSDFFKPLFSEVA